MNQQLAKVSQRQIRRALGSEANAMLNAHAEAMKIINQDMAAQKAAFDALEKEVGGWGRDMCEHERRLDRAQEFMNRGWRDRLRWLVFGR